MTKSQTSAKPKPSPKAQPPAKAQPAKPKSSPTRPKVYYAIFLIAWVVLSMIISQSVVGAPMFWLLGEKFVQPLWTGLYYLLSYSLAIALIIFVPPRLSKKLSTTPTELGIDRWPTFVDIGLAPIGYIVYIMLANFLTQLMRFFPWFNADETQDVGFTAGYLSGPEKIIAIISLVVIAPLAEELIMRGWLYGKLRSRTKCWVAIILTSLTFALLHGQWNVGVSVFMLSVVLCSLREITGTIWSGVLLHMLSNGIAFYLLYIAGFY